MTNNTWKILIEIFGDLQAQFISGLLQANHIPHFLSQEAVGKVYGLNIAPLGKVTILVPETDYERAVEILQENNVISSLFENDLQESDEAQEDYSDDDSCLNSGYSVSNQS